MNLSSSKISSKTRVSSILVHEQHPHLSRKTATLLAGSGSIRKISIGTLLSSVVTLAALSVSTQAGAENVGGGSITMDASPATGSVLIGDYVISCTKAGADGVAKFEVEKPDGTELSAATAGTAYGKHIKFTISASGADFAVGDQFTVTVKDSDGEPSDKVVDWDPNDPEKKHLCGVSLRHCEAPDGTDVVDGVEYLRRLGVISKVGIVWPAGVTDEQKAAALATLDDNLAIAAS